MSGRGVSVWLSRGRKHLQFWRSPVCWKKRQTAVSADVTQWKSLQGVSLAGLRISGQVGVTWGSFLLSNGGKQRRILLSAHPLGLLCFLKWKERLLYTTFENGRAWFNLWGFFLEGISLLVFDCTVKVRRSFALSSIDYGMKPSRCRLKSVSSASLD